MKQFLICIFIFAFSGTILAQVGINNTNPKASLDITATNQATPSNTDGLLIPRIDDFPATPPTAAQQGMLVYLTTISGGNAPGYYYWDNNAGPAAWVSVLGNTVEKLDDLSDGKSDSDGTNDGSSVFLGINAGANDDSSNNRNVGIGSRSLNSNTTGTQNTAVGSESLGSNTTGFSNTAIGYTSLYTNTTGYGNTTIGVNSLLFNTTGNYNTSLGLTSLRLNTTGERNTAIGAYSLYSNTTGGSNTANGIRSLYSNTTGNSNTALGNSAGYNSLGGYNVFLGSNAGYSETGSNKLYIENSNTNQNNALIYGEFDTNILRTNGEFQIGNPTGTGYAFPTTDGSVNQILQTDGIGQLSFINPNLVGTDDQNITGSGLTGTNLTIGIENGNPQTIDLSSLQDADWYESGGTPPNDINDDIYTLGKVKIGLSTFLASDGTLSILSNDNYALTLTNTNNSAQGLFVKLNADNSGIKTGMEVNLTGTTAGTNYINTGYKFTDNLNGTQQRHGIVQNFNGTNTNTSSYMYGISNSFFSTSNYQGIIYAINNLIGSNFDGIHYGVYNSLVGTGNGSHYGIYNQLTGTGNGNKYGTYNFIDTSANGTHYGVYSDVQSPTGYAGFFKGRVSFGLTGGGDNYVFPQTRGTNGQVMRTDGVGNISWITPVDNDNQNITGSGLTGTNLIIGIENGTSQTIDLSSLQDGTGTDDQNITGSGLTGTILTIGIENGTSQTIDLSSLQDGGALKIDDLLDGKSDNDGSEDGASVFLGINAGAGDDSSDNQNIGIGFQALQSNTTGIRNIAIGYNSLNSNTGNLNTAVGYQTLVNNISGGSNTAFGYHSLKNNTTGNFNIAIGVSALLSNKTGSNAIAIGSGAMANANSTTTAYDNLNIAIGVEALKGTNPPSSNTGNNNTALGSYSLIVNTSGDNNVANGYNTLSSNTTGNNNTSIGSGSGTNNSLGSGNVFLGYQSGYNEIGSNKLYIESSNADANNALIYGEFDTNILRTNGELQIGNPISSGYAFPATDGTLNQLMYTDGNGALSWINSTFLGTDDQTIDQFNLSGTTLNLSLENDGVATQIVDLSSLQDGDTQNTLDQAYDEGSAGAGRTITADSGAISIEGTDGFQVIGTSGSGAAITLSGAGTRMFFNPSKASFRAGYVGGTQWDVGNVGNYSFASGYNTTASGEYSTAMGNSTYASGNYSTAMGRLSTASALISTAMGDSTTASGFYSTAMGQYTTASGGASTAMGQYTIASGEYSTAMGLWTLASGANSTAAGVYTTALSFAETAIGSYNTTYTPSSTSVWNGADRLFVIGNGVDNANRSNALTIYKNGLLNINDAYNMPLTDGTANQLMFTDGSGNLNWVNTSSLGTDDQNLTGATLTGTSLQIDIENGNSTTADLSGLQDADWFEAGNTPPNSISDNIYTNGRVGINISTPDTRLHLKHINSGTSGGFKLENLNANSWRLYVSSGASGDFRFYSSVNGNALTAAINGTTGTYSALSDRRLKKDFNDLYFDWKNFMKLKPLTYRFKTQKNEKKHIGLVAQDVDKIYPELVSYTKDEDVYQLDYSATGIIAIKAVQELKKEVEILSQENQQLKQQIKKYENLEARLSALENNNDQIYIAEKANK